MVVATHDAMYEKVRSNVQEIKAREGRVIAFVSKGEQDITRMAGATIELPDTLECAEPLMATVPPAVAGLLYRCLQRQGCGPAAQPGQERDGGITKKQ